MTQASQLNYWPELFDPFIKKEGITNSYLCFKVYQNWFAFSITVISKVMLPRTIYPIAHNNIPFLLGIAKAKREMQLVICLEKFLFKDIPQYTDLQYQRYILVHVDNESLIFPAFTVLGIYNISDHEWIRTKNEDSICPNHFIVNDHCITILDPTILFQKIKIDLNPTFYSGI